VAAHIRAFRPSDRAALRRIAVDTADRGSPGRWLFPYTQVTADLLTRYYTDFEPDMCLVAEHEGGLIGYALGTVHPRRHRLIMRTRVIPRPCCVRSPAGRCGNGVPGNGHRLCF